MYRTIITLFALLTVTTLSAQIQEQTVREKLPHQKKKYTIATQPLYNFYNGLRFDFEMRIKDTPAWISAGIAGQLFVPSQQDYPYNQATLISGDELNRLRGIGLELNYKYFFNKVESLYFAGGCSYSRYNIEYIDWYWNSYIDEYKLEYHEYRFGSLKQNINKFGISAYFGYQIPKPTFLFDMFVGLGYRYSFKSNRIAHSFDDGMLSLGYKGVVFITGVRFGVRFKQ
jgi:opacity protein-like surface antigen